MAEMEFSDVRVKGELKQIEDKRVVKTKTLVDNIQSYVLRNEAEDEFALSGKEKETQFFVRGVHTHYSANNLELWRLEAQNKAEKAEMITAINLISNRLHEKRNREVQEEKLRKKMIGQSAVTPYEFIVWLIHDQDDFETEELECEEVWSRASSETEIVDEGGLWVIWDRLIAKRNSGESDSKLRDIRMLNTSCSKREKGERSHYELEDFDAKNVRSMKGTEPRCLQ
ncbi:hypothetical protein AAMO2058_000757800 [Amorphochlora amoebiformis]